MRDFSIELFTFFYSKHMFSFSVVVHYYRVFRGGTISIKFLQVGMYVKNWIEFYVVSSTIECLIGGQ